eukprot:8581576-Pyramimonas_sp.AAC.1
MCSKRRRAARRREPDFQNCPPSIREAFAHVYNGCARREGESHILNTARPPSVTSCQIYTW